MSKPSFKELVNYIEKMGRGAPPPKPGQGYVAETTPAPTTTSTTNSGATPSGRAAPPKPGQQGRPTGTVVSREVLQMQIAMQRLSKTVSSTIDYAALNKAFSAQPGVDKKQVENSIGRDAFSNFIVSRMRTSKVEGVEYDPNIAKTKMEDKNPSDLKAMMVILNTLQRIGQGQKEDTPDGKWGPRTNNALLNITALANTLVRLGTELGMTSQSFDAGKVNELGGLIPQSEEELKQVSFQERAKRAVEITKILNGVHSLFLDFKEQVVNNPNYKSYIDGESSLFEVGTTKDKTLEFGNDGEKAIYQDLQTNRTKSRFIRDNNGAIVPVAKVNIPAEYTGNKQIPTLTLTSADLVDQKSFEDWARAANPSLKYLMETNPGTWKNVVTLILDDTKKQIQQRLKPSDIPETREA